VTTRRTFLTSSAGWLLASSSAARAESTARGLLTGHPEAAEAGNAVLAAGGNAVDAIVAGALVAGVVALPATGIGGYGGHLVLASPKLKPIAIDFNTTAPAAAKPDMFKAEEQGKVAGGANSHGWLAAGVPGVLAGLQLALDKFGTKPFADLLKPAIKFASDGFPIKKNIAASFKAAAGQFAKDAGAAKLFLKSGEPLAEGDTFRNPDLARLLERLAEKGVADFYTGKTAEAVAAAFKKNGGLVTVADFAAYRALEVTPLALDWCGHTIHTPPPTSGSLTVLQALATLKALEWEKKDPKEPATTQFRLEALRVAWRDRLRSLGDPKHFDVPIAELISEKHAQRTALKVWDAVRSGKPIAGVSDCRPAGGTIHLCAVDKDGLSVALTFTHGESFGAQVAVDGLGLVLGHGISRFDPRPGRANSIGPGKKPLHNMCPTIVMKGDKRLLALGATGGRRIPNTLFDVLSYRIGQGKPLAEAVKAPRIHTEGDLNLTLEAAWPAATVDHLKTVGYTVKTGGAATLNAIEREPDGKLTAAAR